MSEYGGNIKCAPYDNHFIYASQEKGQSAYMCTCGSPAVVVPPGPQGMFLCLFDAENGHHATTEVDMKDFH